MLLPCSWCYLWFLRLTHLDSFPGMQTFVFLNTKWNFICNLPHLTKRMYLPRILVLSSRSLKLEQCSCSVCISKMPILSTPRQHVGKNFKRHGATPALPTASYHGGTMRKMGFLCPSYNGQFLGWPRGIYF